MEEIVKETNKVPTSTVIVKETNKVPTSTVIVKQVSTIRYPRECSKIVFVRRKKMIGLPGQDLDDCKMKIGSGYKNSASLRGLNFEEEERFLPLILSITPSNENWKKTIDAYWAGISKEVPSGDGLKLEVGLTYKNQKEFDEDQIGVFTNEGALINPKGFPINLNDYILWRYCLVYSRVANSIDDVGKSPKIEFYLYSKDKEISEQKETFNNKRNSLKLLYSNLSDNQWKNFTLRVLVASDKSALNTISFRDLDNMSEDEKDLVLNKYAETYPTKFLAIGNDKNLQMRAFIEECIANTYLTRIPNTDSVSLEGNTIGNSIEEVVTFLNNPKNSTTLQGLRARIQHSPK